MQILFQIFCRCRNSSFLFCFSLDPSIDRPPLQIRSSAQTAHKVTYSPAPLPRFLPYLLACSLVRGALEMAVAVNAAATMLVAAARRQLELRQCVRASVFGYAVSRSPLEGSLLFQVLPASKGGRGQRGREREGMVANVCAGSVLYSMAMNGITVAFGSFAR